MRTVRIIWPMLTLLLFCVLPIMAQTEISEEELDAYKAEIRQLAAQKAYRKALSACDLLLKKLKKI